MDTLLTTLKGLGPVRLGLLGALAVVFLGVLIYSFSRLSTPDMALLYGDLDMTEGAQIISKLETMGVPVEIKGGGTQVYVPADQVLRLRMSMAESGLPSGGSIGYEIFDRSEVLGSTSFIQDVNLLRALEGELSRTIRSLQPVASARVHIVLPKRELFSREQQSPTASVVLKMRGNLRLNRSQAQAIQQLIASSVPSLKADQVSIIDDRGTLIAKGEGNDPASAALGYEETRKSYEIHIARVVESLLEKSLGPGRVRAEVSVEMDLDRLTEQSETFNPDGQVVRSTQNTSEKEQNQNGAEGATTFQNTLPNAATGGGGGGSKSDSQKSEETINYEISKTMKTYIKEFGGIKRISVAVLVDGDYRKNEKGEEAYAPKSPQEISQIEKLVKAAVGFKTDRGDTVEIVNMRFSTKTAADFEDSGFTFLGFGQQDMVRLVEMLILAAVVALVALFVVRPLLNRMLDMAKPALAEGVDMNALGQGSAQGNGKPAEGTSQEDLLTQTSEQGDGEEDSEASQMRRILGQMGEANLEQIEALVNQHPEGAALILRTWMRQN